MVMTVAEVQAELLKLPNEFPIGAHIYCRITSVDVTISVYPKGILDQERVEGTSRNDNFSEAFAELRSAWMARRERYDVEMIRNMALAIIRITADRGQCDAFALRADKFTQEDIDAYGERAVEDANRIAAGGPFSIVSSLANAA